MESCTCPEWITNSRELCPSCEKEMNSWEINEDGFLVQSEA
jgi:hypothetical protein